MGKGRTRKIKTMALDLRHKQTPKQRAVEKAFIKGGGRHPFYMCHIAAGSGLRENWEHKHFTQQRAARRLHLSPVGTYFWLAGLEPVTGLSLRTDGSTRAFYGPWERPLTCVGCGDASKQEDILCDQINKVPEALLEKLGARDDLAPNDLLGRLKRDGGVAMKVVSKSKTKKRGETHEGARAEER